MTDGQRGFSDERMDGCGIALFVYLLLFIVTNDNTFAPHRSVPSRLGSMVVRFCWVAPFFNKVVMAGKWSEAADRDALRLAKLEP